MELVLASASPRRQELLALAGLRFVVAASDIDESRIGDESPLDYVARLAAAKARAQAGPDRCVLAADTIVVVAEEPRILGKPRHADDARSMLARLSGSIHTVMTGYAIYHPNAVKLRVVQSEVAFSLLSPSDVEGYLHSGEWRDKAGGYAVQGLAAAFVRSITGSYSNIVGLPLCEVIADLRALKIVPPSWGIGQPC